jgi:transcriptional regulator with XRE-family HTH domain
MARTTIKELKQRRLDGASAAERAEFDETYAAAALAIRVGEQIRDAREAAELSQRGLAQRMGTSQAAIARLKAGGVGATLTTLQRAASTLNLDITVELRPASSPETGTMGCRHRSHRASIARTPSFGPVRRRPQSELTCAFAFVDVRTCTFDRVCKQGSWVRVPSSPSMALKTVTRRTDAVSGLLTCRLAGQVDGSYSNPTRITRR